MEGDGTADTEGFGSVEVGVVLTEGRADSDLLGSALRVGDFLGRGTTTGCFLSRGAGAMDLLGATADRTPAARALADDVVMRVLAEAS